MAADVVDIEVLFNGSRKYTVRLTNRSVDGTGETTVTKVDRSTLVGPHKLAPARLAVEEITWSISGYEAVLLFWDDSSNEKLSVLNGHGYVDYRPYGGLVPDTNAAGDVTATKGDILLTTLNAAANDTYDILLTFRLKA